jgi:hypothetical protein
VGQTMVTVEQTIVFRRLSASQKRRSANSTLSFRWIGS